MSDELDDFFRQELDGHATKPGADLWARLQARTAAQLPAADADPLDAKFRAGLAGYATPPRRALWERLEDEHLQPRQRRRPVVAWGRLAVAASQLKLVLAGGAGWWRSQWGQPVGPVASTAKQPVATSPAAHPDGPPGAASGQPSLAASQPSTDVAQAATTKPGVVSRKTINLGAEKTAEKTPSNRPQFALIARERPGHEKNPNYAAGQATAPGALPSSSPVASTGRPRRTATAQRPVPAPLKTNPLPDATAGTLARDGGRKTPAGQSSLSSSPANAPALALASADAAPSGIVEVEVRRGAAPAQPGPAPVAVADAPAATRRPHLRVGGLLRQADHLLHGEAVSLADAREPGEPLTLQAHLGGRVLSKTIQL